MLKTLILLFSTCLLVHAIGQNNFEQELKSALSTNPALDVRFDTRHSFINQSGVKVFGFKLGLQYDNKLSIGVGYNQLFSPVETTRINGEVEERLELAFYNFSPYIEYIFYRDNKWEMSIPVQFGFGSSYYNVISNESVDKVNQKFVISYEPAITFQYRFWRYFGIGAGVGYRFMIKPNPELSEKFTSPVYIFKSNIYFEDIWKDVMKKK